VNFRRLSTLLVLATCLSGRAGFAQTSSLGAQKRSVDAGRPPERSPREAPPRPRNLVYERFGWITVTPAPPKTFRPGDLITIIVREQRKWEADADLKTKNKYDVKTELDAFIKPTQGGVGAAEFRRGKPNIDFQFDQKLTNKGDSSREDRLTTRLTTEIIDVKPNGVLVLEGRAKVTHDEEVSEIALTGTCRKEDVTADNTILSTQVADKQVVVTNSGALRATTTRGWLGKLVDWLKPF